MANRSNRVEVPEAKAAMDRFKTEVASELGVNLKDGYNGDLTSKEAGSIGGEMVRRMIKKQEESRKYRAPRKNRAGRFADADLPVLKYISFFASMHPSSPAA